MDFGDGSSEVNVEVLGEDFNLHGIGDAHAGQGGGEGCPPLSRAPPRQAVGEYVLGRPDAVWEPDEAEGVLQVGDGPAHPESDVDAGPVMAEKELAGLRVGEAVDLASTE